MTLAGAMNFEICSVNAQAILTRWTLILLYSLVMNNFNVISSSITFLNVYLESIRVDLFHPCLKEREKLPLCYFLILMLFLVFTRQLFILPINFTSFSSKATCVKPFSEASDTLSLHNRC